MNIKSKDYSKMILEVNCPSVVAPVRFIKPRVKVFSINNNSPVKQTGDERDSLQNLWKSTKSVCTAAHQFNRCLPTRSKENEPLSILTSSSHSSWPSWRVQVHLRGTLLSIVRHPMHNDEAGEKNSCVD